MNKPETYPVKISVENRQVKLEPVPRLFVDRGDTIEWTCDFPFAIHFPGITPLGKGRIRPKEGKTISTAVRNDAQPGCYKYFVAVYFDGNIWTDDPDFIVKPPKR